MYSVKLDISHLSNPQLLHLKMLFVEAKWLYNDALTFLNDHDLTEYNYKSLTVQGLDKDRQPVRHELQYISSHMRQSVIQGLMDNMKGLAALRAHNRPITSAFRVSRGGSELVERVNSGTFQAWNLRMPSCSISLMVTIWRLQPSKIREVKSEVINLKSG